MITLIVWCLTWKWARGDTYVATQFTDPQMAIFFLICVANDMNMILGAIRKR